MGWLLPAPDAAGSKNVPPAVCVKMRGWAWFITVGPEMGGVRGAARCVTDVVTGAGGGTDPEEKDDEDETG